MIRIISVVGLALCILGVWQGAMTYSFLQRASEVRGSVTGVQELRGPPKPRQKRSVHVLYRDQAGDEVSAVTHLPMLQEIKTGDEIRLLIDPANPSIARIPLWSELWARPLTYIVGGLLLSLVGRVLRNKQLR
ncbi:MAG: DUF3592 domain-containing protein [Pseudomonadota bacterium]|jgi:hypothetical protein